MEEPREIGQGEGLQWQREKGGFLRQLGKSTYEILSFAAIFYMCFIGGCFIISSWFPDDYPQIRRFLSRDMTALACRNTTSTTPFGDGKEAWKRLQPTLKILKAVCPEAEAWVVDRYNNEKITYTWGHTGYYAAYQPLFGHLYMNKSLFYSLNDGEKAAVLAHEFRHSRQRITKHIMTVSTIFFAQDTTKHFNVVELEAEAYQQQVMEAIFR